MALLDLFLAMLWFFLFAAWIWLLVSVFADIVRSDDLGGVAKAVWTIFVLVLPLLGVFVYLLVRGGKMHERQFAAARAAEQAQKDYIREVAGGAPSTADELTKLSGLRDRGSSMLRSSSARRPSCWPDRPRPHDAHGGHGASDGRLRGRDAGGSVGSRAGDAAPGLRRRLHRSGGQPLEAERRGSERTVELTGADRDR
jgi:hypothetical protein